MAHHESWVPPGRFLDNCMFLFGWHQSRCAGIKIKPLRNISFGTFWKKPKSTILHLILHSEFIRQVKNIFWKHIWMPDIISFHLIGHTVYFDEENFFCRKLVTVPNKAGYTANTSRGRSGRGGISCFRTFSTRWPLRTNRPTNWRLDKASYGVATPRRKRQKFYFFTKIHSATYQMKGNHLLSKILLTKILHLPSKSVCICSLNAWWNIF